MHRPTNLHSRTKGFTMIELLFAMSFVSVLLIIILTATLNITRIYNKGITLKQVNQSGANIGSELQASLTDANPTLIANSPIGRGRLCLGTYSYVWNTPEVAPQNTLDDGRVIGMVKVTDSGGTLCQPPYKQPLVSASTELLPTVNPNNPGVQLELRDFSVMQAAQSGANYVYRVSYTVSTSDDTLIKNDSCTGGASDEFCALNAFTFLVFMKQGGDGSV